MFNPHDLKLLKFAVEFLSNYREHADVKDCLPTACDVQPELLEFEIDFILHKVCVRQAQAEQNAEYDAKLPPREAAIAKEALAAIVEADCNP